MPLILSVEICVPEGHILLYDNTVSILDKGYKSSFNLYFFFFFLVLLKRCVKRPHFAGGLFLWGRSPSPSSYIFIADSPGHFRITGRLGPAALCTLSGWVIQTKYVWNISGSAECHALGYSYQLQLNTALCRVHECVANCVTSQWTLC